MASEQPLMTSILRYGPIGASWQSLWSNLRTISRASELVLCLAPVDLGVNPSPATCKLCDLGQLSPSLSLSSHISNFSHLGPILCRGHLAIFVVMTGSWGLLLASGGQRSGMLLNFLQRTGQPRKQVNSAKDEKPCSLLRG